MSLSRHSIGVGIRQRFGDFAENFSGSVDLTIDYPISSSAKEGGTTWKPKPGIGYKLSVPLEWFVENSSWWILAEPYYRKFKMKASDTVSGTTYSESTHTFTGINIGVGADF